ncbi:MAG: hypothetical protein H0T68_06665 [Gemmatimonadales bacterium]|nr:hypothetical protein [Gemmatimonadales bacterium]
MRSLGTLGGPVGFAFSVNTHRRVVGSSLTADDLVLPFLWRPERGIQPLPTLGGNFGEALYLNEFGRIAGTSTNARGADRATLWTPTPGPLLVEAAEEMDEPGIASAADAPNAAHATMCARARRVGEWSRIGTATSRTCAAR